MLKMTKKQEAIRKFIQDELTKGRSCPSRREIASHFGFASHNAVNCHLNALIQKGVLIADEGKVRALRLAENFAEIKRAAVAEIPFFGSIPAGFGEDREQEAEGCVLVDIATIGFKPTRNTFCLQVKGDSMI